MRQTPQIHEPNKKEEPARIDFTENKISALPVPAHGEKTYWDQKVVGLGVRCLKSGRRSYIVRKRSGHGRKAPSKVRTLGRVGSISLSAARKEAKNFKDGLSSRIAAMPCIDQAAEPHLTAEQLIQRYADLLRERGAVDVNGPASFLRRKLVPMLENSDLRTFTRERAAKIRDSFLKNKERSSAKVFMMHVRPFLSWCADHGYIASNPVQDLRLPKSTRSETAALEARRKPDLSFAELFRIWRATYDARLCRQYGLFLRAIIALGQRRTATSLMLWPELAEDCSWWTSPSATNKMGYAHEVPIPEPLRSEFVAARRASAGLRVFQAPRGQAISTWSENLTQFREIVRLDKPFDHHSLRVSHRSRLTQIGIDSDTAEIMIGHRGGGLQRIYDRDPRDRKRATAARLFLRRLLSEQASEMENNPADQ